jgi:CRISPR type I-E-associated protein CasB/Cse2
MTSETKPKSHFIEYLTGLSSEKNREELAVFKRGLSSPPGQDVRMYRYVAPFVSDKERGTPREKIYYLVAALYGFHPKNCDAGNFGNHMALAASEMNDPASTEKRFTLLLNTDMEDMPKYLRQAVSFLKSHGSDGIPINWQALFKDLLNWDHSEKYVQQNWANGFWGYQPLEESDNRSTNQSNQEKL